MAKKICIIGAGPSGMAVVKHLADIDPAVRPEVVCFERQKTWGGLWNYEWRTGLDEFGEPVHSAVYKNLWINGPKETIELPYYTFDEHFGKPYRSFLTRPENWEYLNGAWTKFNLAQYVKFKTAVRFVKYNSDTDDFKVTYQDIENEVTSEKTFSHVVVASGIFYIPKKPDFPGLADFKGSIIHAHDFREIRSYKGQRLLLIGSGFTSFDIAVMGIKYGIKSATISWRTGPIPAKWPEGITVRPLVKKVEDKVVHFIDGSSEEFDSIIFCTGYQVKFPFMDKDLCQGPDFSFYPDHLYKACLFTEGGNNKLFYIGANHHLPSFTMFDYQALWICKFIQGEIGGEPASKEDMRKDMDEWINKAPKYIGDIINGAIFNVEYMYDLATILDYNTHIRDMHELFAVHMPRICEQPLRFRDYCFRSIFTGTVGCEPEEVWLKNMDEHV